MMDGDVLFYFKTGEENPKLYKRGFVPTMIELEDFVQQFVKRYHGNRKDYIRGKIEKGLKVEFKDSAWFCSLEVNDKQYVLESSLFKEDVVMKYEEVMKKANAAVDDNTPEDRRLYRLIIRSVVYERLLLKDQL
jgi:hypothetical protein